MMRGAWLALVALLVCLASTEATQRLFLGGSFSGLDGFSSRRFAQYDAEEGKWQEHVADPGTSIRDLDAVRGGVFVVGDFTQIADRPSARLAFWDGIKWCAIRQGVDGPATSVWCDSDTSCWVAGGFSTVINLQDSNTVQNFAYYVWDENGNEWVFDATQRGWSYLSNHRIGAQVDDGSLVVLPGSTHFFLSTGGFDGSSFIGARTIWRGSKSDNGFWVFVSGDVLQPGLAIIDFSIDLSVSTPVLYLLTNNGTDAPMATAKSNLPLTFACESDPCVEPLTTPTNYTQVASSAVNATVIQTYHRIYAAPNDVRYLIATYDPDGLGTEFSARQRVMRQTASGVPELVGSPFEVDTGITFLQTAVPLALLHDGSLLVQGSFSQANLYYTPDPLTTDTSGVTNDRRSQDLATGFAVYNTTSALYKQAFGGGFGSTGHQNVRWVHDNSTNQYYFLGSSIRYVYNTRADKAAWYDDDESLSIPLFPLFDRNLLRRSSGVSEGEVLAITCDTSSCEEVYVGGQYSFHGPDTVGSIAKVSVGRTSRVVTEVGGGLHHVAVGLYDPDVDFQSLPGSVYALVRQGDHLYVGGQFERGGAPTSITCLSHITRIDVASETAAWEDLDGGCDDAVYDIEFFDGLLFAAGDFEICGNAHVGFVAAYDYQETGKWQSLRVGLDGPAFALEVFQDRLIVGGEFGNAGGLPVSGVASWDGFKWRALLPACTDDCVGTHRFYYNNLVSPQQVYDLKADPEGEFLWARGSFSLARKRGSAFVALVRWEYNDGDLGQWTAKGDHLNFNGDFNPLADAVAFLTNDVVVVAGDSGNDEFNTVNGHISPYNAQLDNWYGGFRTQSQVYVVAEGVGSASSLSSPLASLLAFF